MGEKKHPEGSGLLEGILGEHWGVRSCSIVARNKLKLGEKDEVSPKKQG